MLPCRPFLISSSEGCGFSRRSAVALISIPGVQYPHCSAWCELNACCSFVSSSPSASPSTVSMLEPSAWTASIMQLFASVPSTITEHAPQLPVSHPMWLPVRSRSSRMKWISSFRASTSRSYVVPLTVTEIVCEVETVSASTWSAPVLRCLGDGANGEHLREVRAVLARRVHVGGRGEARGVDGSDHGCLVLRFRLEH